MKSVLIISSITFVLIFGGVALLALQLGKAAATESVDDVAPADRIADERVQHDLQAERDRVQREHERLAGLRQAYAVQAQMIEQASAQLEDRVVRLESRQETITAQSEESYAKLAKMYEAMNAQKAAPILAALELDVTLEILRRMKERQAANILSFMDAGVAAQLSTRLSRQEQR